MDVIISLVVYQRVEDYLYKDSLPPFGYKGNSITYKILAQLFPC